MGLRSRLKQVASRLVGSEGGAAPASAQPSSAAPHHRTAPREPARGASAPAPSPPVRPPVPADVSAPSAAPTPSTSEGDDDRARQAAAKAKLVARATRGVLTFLDTEGGTAGLGPLHECSEGRYMVGHQAFSQMLEKLIDDGHVSYDHDRREATITAAGRAFIGR